MFFTPYVIHSSTRLTQSWAEIRTVYSLVTMVILFLTILLLVIVCRRTESFVGSRHFDIRLKSSLTIRNYRFCLSAAASDAKPSSTKARLLELLETAPSNAPTPRSLTEGILDVVRVLEKQCPTEDGDVLGKLVGTWELVWTAQDTKSPESNRRLRSWINPLENQSYSNNPRGGRSNPFLPIELQGKLEKAGFVSPSPSDSTLRSTQTIDMKSQQVRNVVAISTDILGRRQTYSLTVSVDFWPNPANPRQIDVKFQSCRISPLGWTIPLGILGPKGWLRTDYIDNNLRVTRGHKGSVFVLKRPRS
jgi:hypothetical protein